MQIFQAFVIFCVFGSTFAQIISTGPCPPVRSLREFNTTKFLGRWYQGERIFARFDALSRCNFYDYAPGGDGNPLTLTETFSYAVVTNLATVTRELYLPDENCPADFIAQFPLTPPRSPSNLSYLGTDYKSYAVVYSCTERGSVHSIYSWLVFRKRHPTRSARAKAYKILAKNNIDRKLFHKTDQDGCSDGPELISDLI